MTEHVPTLSAGAIETDAFARAIATAYERYGFVVIADHGIDQPLIDGCLDACRAFFALPDEVKRRYHLPGTGGARGYTPFGVETAKGADHHDLKEFWHVGRELPPGHRHAASMPPNLWVAEVPRFRERTLALWEAFDALGRRLLTAIAHALGLPRDYFEDKVDLGNSVLRVLHYPPTADTTA
ncbi:MAG TPA: 2-oxoglutarate and iron-dependent oxygenase domain-containing protein, partial [Steroidobacteraceae bacterium]|nr:2-oxoglutarate and iron-dependent oxygenase domain-containing protein [Steroidobacteraceae bacterium]